MASQSWLARRLRPELELHKKQEVGALRAQVSQKLSWYNVFLADVRSTARLSLHSSSPPCAPRQQERIRHPMDVGLGRAHPTLLLTHTSSLNESGTHVNSSASGREA